MSNHPILIPRDPYRSRVVVAQVTQVVRALILSGHGTLLHAYGMSEVFRRVLTTCSPMLLCFVE